MRENLTIITTMFLLVFFTFGTTPLSVYSLKNVTSNSTMDQNFSSRHCSYQHLQYCHRYIKNIFLLYTGIGGWVLLGIILVGVFLQIRFLLTGRNFDGVLTLKRRDVGYEAASIRRNKKSSFMTQGKAEIGQEYIYSP